MTDIWARTAGHLYLNKKHANNYVSTQIRMLPTANILSLSLPLPVQLSDLIWISDSTSHTAGWGKTGRVGKETSFNWSCLAVLSWAGFKRRGSPLKLGKKEHPKMLRSKAQSGTREFFCKTLTRLCSLSESNATFLFLAVISSLIVSPWRYRLMWKSP